ncbi:Transcription factor pbcR [Cladobotryum mycophilum]|uniref:Transcription factor pbcR n=1 Tax=Cladobotryum mycophilum TaxID=491253 RepID=A0ABR0SFG2_9HYPO
MDLDPRLRSLAAVAAVGDDGAHSSSNSGGRVAASSSTPSPSSQLVQQPHLPPHHGQENSDTPSSTVGSGKEAQHHQEQHRDTSIDGDHNGNGADTKKSRACETCRNLKVRCEPDPGDGPCKRCKKAGRDCVVTAPTRKRQKKTDSRVTELEKKIDALTASLQARAAAPTGHPMTFPGGATTQQQQQPPPPPPPPPPPQQQQQQQQQQRHGSETSTGYGTAWGNGGSKSWGGMEASPMMQSAIMPGQGQLPQEQGTPPAYQPPIVMAGQKRKALERPDPIADDGKSSTSTPLGWSSSLSRPNEGDIIDRGLITMEDAASLFNKYKDHMVRHLPAVVFPPSMSVMDLRKSKPTLFLAIMAAATGENHSLQRVLQRELMQIFAEKVFLTGEKNLELVQALHVAVIWYWPPEHFEELKFYQLVHVAAVMAIDIGLGKKVAAKRAPPLSDGTSPLIQQLSSVDERG